ncbi:MAG TPA: Si-specific NAD(P)(+) transhydrogenase [Nitrospiria bacterium]|nr:Si-specific NAD(P)(+) transhydrogenase [Nitrospiria bacterium]
MKSQFDLIVIGGGPAGQKGAVQAAKFKKSVAIVEKEEYPGGICLYTGTLPSKTLRETAVFYQGFRKRALQGMRGMACTMDKTVTFTDLMHRKDEVIHHERQIVADQLARNDVHVIRGRARFINPHEVEVDTDGTLSRMKAGNFLIATGSRPDRPGFSDRHSPPAYDSDDILKIDRIPRTMTVLGGGVIGCEYACIFSALGTKITLIDRRKVLLRFMDEEISAALEFHVRQMGMTLKLGEDIQSIEMTSSDRVVTRLKSGKEIHSECLLSAMGRRPATEELDLAAGGVELTDRGQIRVDENYRTSAAHIYAAGDVIGFPALASTSMDQGRLAVCHMFGHPSRAYGHLLPYGVYTIPEISVVGRTEQELTEALVPYETGVARFREIARGQIIGETEGILKLIFHQVNRELLGVHVIGEGATELVHIGQAVIAHGGKIDYFVDSVFNYPTLAEAYKVAALNGINKLL